MKMKRVRQARLIHCCYELRHFGDTKKPLSFDLWEWMLMLWQVDKKKGYTKFRIFLTSVTLWLQFSVTCKKQWRRIYIRIVNPSIEKRLFNLKRPVELRQTFSLDLIFNVIHIWTLYKISVPFTRLSQLFLRGKKLFTAPLKSSIKYFNLHHMFELKPFELFSLIHQKKKKKHVGFNRC